jgi:hypothetical protein
MPDYGHVGRPSTYLAVAGSCGAQLRSNCAPSHSRDRDLQIDENCRVPLSLDFNKAQTREKASRQDRKDASGKTGAAFWFWETDDDDRANLRHLIEIGEQFDLIMIGTQDIGLERIIILRCR